MDLFVNGKQLKLKKLIVIDSIVEGIDGVIKVDVIDLMGWGLQSISFLFWAAQCVVSLQVKSKDKVTR